ncbi:hypothetical protein [Rhizobium lentis]|uniref:hypothetical protein n=1 Tax=Rhizobium lentis TaxID=1138194 RepID=UPI00287F8094|nr:hypothetical protein [Rhizobium lentis]
MHRQLVEKADQLFQVSQDDYKAGTAIGVEQYLESRSHDRGAVAQRLRMEGDA